jgi:hypothetical protein
MCSCMLECKAYSFCASLDCSEWKMCCCPVWFVNVMKYVFQFICRCRNTEKKPTSVNQCYQNRITALGVTYGANHKPVQSQTLAFLYQSHTLYITFQITPGIIDHWLIFMAAALTALTLCCAVSNATIFERPRLEVHISQPILHWVVYVFIWIHLMHILCKILSRHMTQNLISLDKKDSVLEM